MEKINKFKETFFNYCTSNEDLQFDLHEFCWVFNSKLTQAYNPMTLAESNDNSTLLSFLLYWP